MKRDYLETYIGKQVELTLFDGSIYKGLLRKGMVIGNGYVIEKRNTYNISNLSFRLSHVKKIKELENEN